LTELEFTVSFKVKYLPAAVLALGFTQPQMASAAHVIDDLTISATDLRFDVTGTVDAVGIWAPVALFFGFLDGRVWHTGVTGGPASSNGGTYDITGVGGATQNGGYGTYVYTDGSDPMVVGDVVDISYSISGTFDLAVFDEADFLVQAGFNPSELGISVISESLTAPLPAVPLPASSLLLLGGLAGLGLMRRKSA
jgi:hypothetical protein